MREVAALVYMSEERPELTLVGSSNPWSVAYHGNYEEGSVWNALMSSSKSDRK